jgi:hypothetical protein
MSLTLITAQRRQGIWQIMLEIIQLLGALDIYLLTANALFIKSILKC